MSMTLLDNQIDSIARGQFLSMTGRVISVGAMHVDLEGLFLPVGSFVEIQRDTLGCTHEHLIAQVVSLHGSRQRAIPLESPQGVRAGALVKSAAGLDSVAVGRNMLGTVLDGLGRPIGGNCDFAVEGMYPVYAEPPIALERRPILQPLPTGIRSIDSMHTFGMGQRMGVFAGTGVGKSILMGMIARQTAADVIVVALVGERGREVGDFLRKDLGEEGMKRCVMVVSTSDESPVMRVRAGFVATAVSEYFRDRGQDVLLMMDSTTRIAMAQREIGLAAGEPPATKGYPPSTFSLLPRLLERSGQNATGSITGLYTVLVEGDDLNEPISDAMRGILDGHVWLSRKLANRGHFPAVSCLESVSRVMPDVVNDEHLRASRSIRQVLATWDDIEDLVNLGAYARGTSPDFDVAIDMKPEVDAFLRQDMQETASWKDTCDNLLALAAKVDSLKERLNRTNVAS
ncbi:MAG: FliI/YscN family ATPase [Phycisphaerae bacterium]